jgi:hypothetical protein
MVKAIGAGFHIEEDFETTKDMGLDHYEVRSWIGWYRHVTLVMLADAFLTSLCAQERIAAKLPLIPATAPLSLATDARPLLPLTVAEMRHLLGQLMWPPPCSMKLVLAWSWWRRCHSSTASYFRPKRRLEAG